MTAAPRHRGDGDGDDGEYDCDRSLPPRRPVKAREQTSQAGVRQRVARDPVYVLKPPTQPELVRISRQQNETHCDGRDERQSTDDSSRRRPVATRKTMKSAGVSLIPAAIPIPIPVHLRDGCDSTSARTIVITSTLIWPSCSESRTGSSQMIGPIRSAVNPHTPVAVLIPAAVSIRRTM